MIGRILVGGAVALVVTTGTALGVDRSAPRVGERFVAMDRAVVAEPARWLTIEHGRLAYGTESEIVVRDERGERRWRSAVPTTDGLLSGGQLTLVTNDGHVLALDLRGHAAALRPLGGVGSLHGPTFLARTPDRMVLAESGVGLHLLPLPGDHHAGHPLPPETIPLDVPFTAVAAEGWRVTLATPGDGLLEFDLRAPQQRRRVRLPAGAGGVTALAVYAERVYVLTRGDVWLTDPDVTWESGTMAGGSDLVVAGRALFIARSNSGSAPGVTRYRDRSVGSVLYPVTVANNFFSPAALEIEVGDRVRWTNASGFHNVYSCEEAQSGCAGKTANEAFTSGAPASPIWTKTHTFIAPGSNPYVCQSHAPFMTGQVLVVAAPAGPPPIGDGTAAGAPMTVAKLDPTGEGLQVAWDTLGCPGAVETQIIWGARDTLDGGPYDVLGARCAIGPGSPYVWAASPSTALDPDGLIWWLLVATDGESVEGSWGVNGQGAERIGSGPGGSSGQCGISARDPSAQCPP